MLKPKLILPLMLCFGISVFIPHKFFGQSINSYCCAKDDSLRVSDLKSRFISLISTFENRGKAITDIKSKADLVNAKLQMPGGVITANSFEVSSQNERISKERKLVSFSGGYVDYNLNFRSHIDTPYLENNILQHYTNVNLQFTIAETVPINVSFTDRESNSAMFRDFRDVRIDFDVAAFRRSRSNYIKHYFENAVQRMEDPLTEKMLKDDISQVSVLKPSLNNSAIITTVIECKENLMLANEKEHCGKWQDSLMNYSEKYLLLFDSLDNIVKKFESRVDSLRGKLVRTKQKIQGLKKFINNNINAAEGIDKIGDELYKNGVEPDRKHLNSLYGLKTFSIGRTQPNFSDLTVKNINVRGINIEYNNSYWYTAFTAGAVDFRVRDFVYGKYNLPSQFVYAGRLGIGKKEGNHFIITGYKGRKQMLSSQSSNDVFGVSAEFQYLIGRNHRFIAEIAHSNTALNSITSGGQSSKQSFNIRDKTSRAYRLQFFSFIPKTKTSIEGNYEHLGLNFQSFNAYRTNANTESWSVKLDQYLLSRQFHLIASVKKNEYSNPLVIQNYNANILFKTVQLTFKKRKWPVVSAAYIPASQLTIINSQVYEGRYQTLTGNISHFWKLGTATMFSNLFITRFYNKVQDSIFIFSNSRNISFFQQMNFRKYASLISVTIAHNQQYTMETMQNGLSTTFLGKIKIEFGSRIYHFNGVVTKVGLYGSSHFTLKNLGVFVVGYDDGYLPGYTGQLIRNEQMNIRFTKYLK